ncbi:NADP-dependent oxidoreductase domain-containing protein [Parachaetomium inaequale]|uniref:NADP-dependent oxidoreductase domain-containing protein n=1 Tax=Parachaetomium inaequale TaxID=2588326 RepID=A0AAN6PF01_9PEZI|nr:NADP-dependent oxidoreductase domain-containing protein [Parachaetomium inaequale]
MATAERKPLNLILGAGNIGDTSIDPLARFDTPDQVNGFLNAFLERRYHQIDTARGYSPHAPGSSEPRLGAVAAGERSTIDTKVMSRGPGCHTKAKILEEIDISLAALQIKQINIAYLHAPDRTTPFEEACEAMDQAYREGKIKKWGISNYTADEVQEFLNICEARGWVKPAVYQGHYNAIVRSNEKQLFPVLRKHGLAFYAYSPAGGGFFAGNHNNTAAGGRFDKSHFLGGKYSEFYVKPSITAATDKAVAVAAQHDIGGHAAALRWTAHHSILSAEHGDSVIVGASSVEQLKANLDMIEQGPLPQDVVAALEAIHAEVGDEASYHFYQKNSPRLRRQAHSHAARASHARARRARVAAHAAFDSTSQKDASESSTHPKAVTVSPARNMNLAQRLGLHVSSSVPASISSSFEHEPLASFLRSLTSREHYLFDFYIQVVTPDMCNRCPVLNLLGDVNRRVRDNWVILSSTNVEMLRGSLLSACRWLSIVHQQPEYAELAIQYKLRLVRDLQETIGVGTPSSRRSAVSKALVLAFDEITIRDMVMAATHLAGALQIIRVAGGIEALELSGLVLFLLSSCVYAKKLLDSDPRMEIPCTGKFLDQIGL